MVEQRPNRRRFPRVKIPAGTHVRCWGNDFRGLVRVLGEGGMFVDTIHPASNGAEVDIVIDSGEPIRARCITRDNEAGQGMGVEFVSLNQEDRTRIRELIAKFT